MARYEIMAPADRTSLFSSLIWKFAARMFARSVAIQVMRRYPEAEGDRWVVEMDDEARLEELAVAAHELVDATPTALRRGRGRTDTPRS